VTHVIVAGDVVEVAGAGPAGLAAAITLARAGRGVVVHEAHPDVGFRFDGDLQGLENWTTDEDALDWLRCFGLTTRFDAKPCHEGTFFDSDGRAYPARSRLPLFYMVERGPGERTLDAAMLAQAHELGVEVRFGSRVARIGSPGVLALGPRAGDAIAVGYHFETPMHDGFWAICDDEVAPGGYAYLLVMNGRGTLKSCMFSDFKHESLYVQRSVAAFERLVDLRLTNPRPHGGVANFRITRSARSGEHPVIGEQAGFQDALWGFGMRLAIASGVLAARSLLEARDYDALWRRQLLPWMRSSIVNRALYDRVGNRGYQWMLRAQARVGDTRRFLRWVYRPGWAKRVIYPWAQARYHSRRRDVACAHVDCTCTWCRCAGEYA
jgi:flavin-dependent dehydrogenase